MNKFRLISIFALFLIGLLYSPTKSMFSAKAIHAWMPYAFIIIPAIGFITASVALDLSEKRRTS